MASKHSKRFFDFGNCGYTVHSDTVALNRTALSMPFKIIISVLIISLVLSSVLVGNFFLQSNAHKKLLADAKSVFESQTGADAIKTLARENEDIKGWLKIDGTAIDCAVCQGEDDSFYINHNQLGKKSRYGALFLSENDTFERKGNDRNIVIFGNNMKDGTMFGTLKKYRNLNFYKQHPCIELYYGEKCETYIVFAVMIVGSSADDGGEIYRPTKSHFASKSDFNAWLSQTCARSLIDTTVQVEYGDEILTLVTVADDFDGARLAVMAKKADEWDAAHTDVTYATVNSQIRYPKAWYTARGMEYPY